MTATTRLSLRETETAALRHIDLYGLTVTEAVQSVTQRRSQRAANRLLLGLQQQGLVRSEGLYGQRHCFILTRAGREQLAGDTSSGARMDRPLSEQLKLRLFAMLSVCCLGNTARQKLTRTELTRVSSDSNRSVPNYYAETHDNRQRYGFLRVDTIRHGRWDRILAKVREDAYGHAADPGFQLLIERGDFEVTLATALPQKAERLCRAFSHAANPLPVPVRVTSIPDLLYLIAPPPS